MIRVQDAHKSFGSIVAVRDLSFSVDVGQIAAFLGPNGSGKTTTMRMIMGFLKPDKGNVVVNLDGQDLYDLKRHQRVGYLPESTPLYPDMSVIECLEFSAAAHHIKTSLRLTRIQSVVASCGLGKHLNRHVSQLSKGYKQRVGLAQALIHDPDVLVLDEPTTGLDPIQVQDILDLIQALGRNKTILLSTHILQHVPAICDKVVVIHEGQLRFEGKPQAFAEFDNERRIGVECAPDSELKNLIRAEGFDCETDENAPTQLWIQSQQPQDDLSRLLDLAKQAQWDMRQVYVERASLDRAFRCLVEGNEP